METAAVMPKHNWAGLIRYRSALIHMVLGKPLRELMQENQAQLNAKMDRCCQFASPIVQHVSYAVHGLESILNNVEEASIQSFGDEKPRSVLLHVFDPRIESSTHRAEVVSRKLQEYFAKNSGFYQSLAERVLKCSVESFATIPNRLVDRVVDTVSQVITRRLNFPTSPRTISAEFVKDLKNVFPEAADLRSQYPETDDYTEYVDWEGQWRKSRPANRVYRKHTVLLSEIVDALLNVSWKPTIPTALPGLNSALTNIAVVGMPGAGKTQLAQQLAIRYGLVVVSVQSVYQNMHDILASAENTQLVVELRRHQKSILKACFDKSYPDESLTIKLVILFLKMHQNKVRGFVIDGLPQTKRQTCMLRDGLCGYDCKMIMEAQKREKSLLLKDVVPFSFPDLPECLFELVVVLSVDSVTAFRHLREMQFRDTIRKMSVVPSVDEMPHDMGKFCDVQKKILQFTADIQSGLLDDYKTFARHVVRIDNGSTAESAEKIDQILSPVLTAKLQQVLNQPSRHLLHGLEALPEEQIVIIPSPPDTQAELPPSKINLDIRVELGTETSNSEVEMHIKSLRDDLLTMADETVFDLVEHIDTHTDPAEKTNFGSPEAETTRVALSRFIYGDTGPNNFLLPKTAEDTKKDPKKGNDSKKLDGKGKETVKSTKGQPSATQKRTAREAKDADTTDDEELGRVKAARPPRKSDLCNPKVRDYLQMFVQEQKQQYTIPQVPYVSSDDENPYFAETSQFTTKEEPGQFSALILTQCDMKRYFNDELDIISQNFKLDRELNERNVERQYLKGTLGAVYHNGYPVIRLHNAVITNKLTKTETGFLDTLDLEFQQGQNLEKFPSSECAHFGDSDYREIVHFNLHRTAPFDVVSVEDNSATAGTFLIPESIPFRSEITKQLAPVQRLAPAKAELGLGSSVSSFFAICSWLADYWRNVEQTYCATAKEIFHSIRIIKNSIKLHLIEYNQLSANLALAHEIRFQTVLFRWQAVFCSIDATKRCRPQFKELMHAQATDFNKVLVNEINTLRMKDLSFQEEIMKNGWVEDRLAMIANCFVSLAQLEMDLYVDSLNLMRDYISATETKSVAVQTGLMISVPYIDLNSLTDRETKRPPPPPTPTVLDAKKPKDAKGPEPEKPTISINSTLIRPLNRDPVFPTYIARKTNAPEPMSIPVQFAEPLSSQGKKFPGPKVERKSQPDAVRKHSKTQATIAGPPPPRDNVEETMLKDIFDKVKDVVRKMEDSEQELRKARILVKPPDDPRKTPVTTNAKGHDKSRPATPVIEAQIPQKSGHEKAIEEETAFLLIRLELILNCANTTISDLKKLIRSVDLTVSAKTDDIHKKELASAAILVDFIHAEIENELSTENALAYHNNQFTLLLNTQFAAMETDLTSIHDRLPIEKLSLYEEFQKVVKTSDRLIYEDLQKALVYGTERSYGKDLIGLKWRSMDSEELNSAAIHLIQPKVNSRLPDGVNIQAAEIPWEDTFKLMCANE